MFKLMQAAAIAAAVASCAPNIPAFARDPTGKYAQSPNSNWYATRHNASGQWCCDESDAYAFEGAYDINADGSVLLHAKEGDVLVEAYKVLGEPNPTGAPVWWHLSATASGTYCFAPGATG